MIGLLCSNERVDRYMNCFHNLLQSDGKNQGIQMMVFTISNIDLTTQTVSGSVIGGKEIEERQSVLPSLIFNLSAQYKRGDIKKLRSLAELHSITLVNPNNRFNQWMVMEILSTFETTKNYVLPYNTWHRDQSVLVLEKGAPYLLIPESGASLSKIIFLPVLSKTMGQLQVEKIRNRSRWLVLCLPHRQFQIVRVHAYKKGKNHWSIGGIVGKRGGKKGNIPTVPLKDASLAMIQYISSFIPRLGHCFLDLLVDQEQNIYFLHLGGWDYQLLKKNQYSQVLQKYYRYLVNFSHELNNMKQED